MGHPETVVGLALFASTLSAGCLPEDDRPPPGWLRVTVEATEPTSGFETDDGWEVTYDSFVMSLGNVWLLSETCRAYTTIDGGYLRVLELLRPDAQLLATVPGLGECSLSFELWRPFDNSLLGEGVDETTKERMQIPGSDAFVQDRGVSLYVAGSASKDAATKAFEWSFREGFGYSGCARRDLVGGLTEAASVEMRLETLFRDGLAGDAELVFEPYAQADMDGDGVITLEELGAVPLPGDPEFDTLAERLYQGLVPRVPRVEGRSCFDGTIAID